MIIWGTPDHRTTLLISGSRKANQEMLAYARSCTLRALERGWQVIAGDAVGVDAAVAQAMVDLYPTITFPDDGDWIIGNVYGLTPEPRHGIRGQGLEYHHCQAYQQVTYGKRSIQAYNLPIRSYTDRDYLMVLSADKVMCITTAAGTPGTLAVYKYAQSQGRQCWLKGF